MKFSIASIALLAFAALAIAQSPQPPNLRPNGQHHPYLGFDRNDYPGDAALATLRRDFSFTGYWLNNPPGERQNTWQGKREVLLQHGFGFLVLFNGRLDTQILKTKKSGTSPAALGKSDAAAAIAAARREHFPSHTILFLDQEEGGRLLPEQAEYLFAWTEEVVRSGYRSGVYASGQPVNEGHGHTITTAEDISNHVAAQHLQPIALWVAQDACPPSNGCVLQPPSPAVSGTPDAMVWQYVQSPRRRSITAACAKTYAADGNCYAPGLSGLYLDLNSSDSPDPSHGR
jgi:hypothetical protein